MTEKEVQEAMEQVATFKPKGTPPAAPAQAAAPQPAPASQVQEVPPAPDAMPEIAPIPPATQ